MHLRSKARNSSALLCRVPQTGWLPEIRAFYIYKCHSVYTCIYTWMYT